MANIWKRKGRRSIWVVDWTDSGGVRHREHVKGDREAAENHLAKRIGDRKKPRPADPNITVDAYADQWLVQLDNEDLDPRTRHSYSATLRLHIRPTFGTAK